MREMSRTWDEPGLEPAEREARAGECLNLALAIRSDPAWQSIDEALAGQIADLLNDLARSNKDDEQNRGAIRALQHVRQMPENLIRAASAELTTHRGT